MGDGAPRARIGLALGSGAARGWAHVGVIRALEQRGVVPDVVAGSSIGAVVGAAWAAGRLDAFEAWGRDLDWRRVVGYIDFSLRGGVIKGRRLFDFLREELSTARIESLTRPFAAVATDLESGREVWLREGPLLDALRASVAVPGVVAPWRVEGRWLVDGGLVNPVPVSLCRALGAQTVIAVDLNTTLLHRRLQSGDAGGAKQAASEPAAAPGPEPATESGAREGGSLRAVVQDWLGELRRRTSGESDADEGPPSLYEVIANAINVMQVRIARSRMAGDPPEILITPRLADFGLFDFDRAAEAIEEGRRATAQALQAAGWR
jgi:NTE family protein